jgi:NADPH:quinone reductase-like Zn-dependent oxidoreductase
VATTLFIPKSAKRKSNSIMMKAVVCTKYGPPEEGLVLKDVEKPIPKDDEVLIKIYTTSVTASDSHLRSMNESFPLRMLLQAIFGFGKPRNPIFGMVLSGVVESVGKSVTLFKSGDSVFAYGSMSAMERRFGSYAEYQCLPESWNLLSKPVNLTHQQAAAIPYGGFLALHCINKGKLKEGDKVLLYGASGSIGTLAIQMAKRAGAVVTAVCSANNHDLVKDLGADAVIDYTADDAVDQLEDDYDVVIDVVGNKKSSALKEACKKAAGKYISIDDDVPTTKKEDFVKIKEMAEEGHLKPVIDRTFALSEMVEAHKYVDQGHKKGNVIISVIQEED